MDKKATLLIKNIHKLYTMEEHTAEKKIYSNSFIAIHHDEIIEVGVHDYAHVVDKDTRIIDGTNHIAIPSFIEVDAQISKEGVGSAVKQHECFMRYMLHGTLTIHVGNEKVHENLLQDYHYEVLQHKRVSNIHKRYPIQEMKKKGCEIRGKTFCICCKDARISLQNQMMAAQFLAMKDEVDAYTLLESLTIHPAKALGLQRYGKIKQGYIANILVLSTSDIHEFFYSLDQTQIAQIIHKGVRIFPNLLI